MRLGHLEVTKDSRPVFICEAGINHNGNEMLAYQMVDAAKEAKADIVKFQLHLPEYEMLPGHKLWDVLSATALDQAALTRLKHYTESLGLVFLCTPFCREAADQLQEMDVVGYKLGSGELTNIPLQRHVAAKGKPMIISTGMSTIAEVQDTMRAVLHINQDIVLMNCASTYPATPCQARLRRIDLLRDVFDDTIPVGQSDHTPTISTALGAIARGAVVIEKHMTLDRGLSGPDHQASILPYEFRQMVDMGTEIWEGMQAKGRALCEVLPEEEPVRAWAQHSLVTTCAVPAGVALARGDLGVKRPGDGIPAAELERVAGLRVVRSMAANQIIRWADVMLD
jgi:sialic acid synthase SpsE